MKTGISAAVALALAGGIAHAEAITVSYQPSLYWALPFHVATEKGWWAQVGLEPSFVTFPAGAPQIAAAQARDWDVGGTGSVPAILGASRFGLKTIGLTNDESRTNAIMAPADEIEAVKADPAQITSLLLTTNSTVDYTARACLDSWGRIPARSSSSTWRRRRSFPRSSAATAVSPVSGRRIPIRCRNARITTISARVPTPMRSFRARWSRARISPPRTPRRSGNSWPSI